MREIKKQKKESSFCDLPRKENKKQNGK